MGFETCDPQKLYDELAKIIGRRENLKITFKLTKKEDKK